MKKIYNNLTKENLMKTEWFKQFTSPQQEIVRLGIQENLDIFWYNKPEYSSLQMNEIRIGLRDNLDVSTYAKKDFNWKQMEQIREKLLKKSTL